jgi:hypothetical protein
MTLDCDDISSSLLPNLLLDKLMLLFPNSNKNFILILIDCIYSHQMMNINLILNITLSYILL